jgi:hypothetical protein
MANKQTEDFEKDIVSFDQAIELATLGFDKQTLCGYDIADRQLYLCQVDEDGIYMPQKDLAAPTKGQVFRWFREKYGWYSNLSTWIYDEEIGTYHEFDIYGNKNGVYDGKYFKTYEEAENACIDKLLVLAKQQDNGK